VVFLLIHLGLENVVFSGDFAVVLRLFGQFGLNHISPDCILSLAGLLVGLIVAVEFKVVVDIGVHDEAGVGVLCPSIRWVVVDVATGSM